MSGKIKFEQEYNMRTAPKILYDRLSTADGLAQWFADDVNIKDSLYNFVWDGIGRKAKIIREKQGKFIRFQWIEDADEDVYFEFKMDIDDLTSDVALIITDFAEEKEMEESKMLWDSQVNHLMHLLGS